MLGERTLVFVRHAAVAAAAAAVTRAASVASLGRRAAAQTAISRMASMVHGGESADGVSGGSSDLGAIEADPQPSHGDVAAAQRRGTLIPGAPPLRWTSFKTLVWLRSLLRAVHEMLRQ